VGIPTKEEEEDGRHLQKKERKRMSPNGKNFYM
jgi:hypothetical protein